MVKEANVSFGQGTAPKRGVTAGEVELMIAEYQAAVEGDVSRALEKANSVDTFGQRITSAEGNASTALSKANAAESSNQNLVDSTRKSYKLSYFGLNVTDSDSGNFAKLCTAISTGQEIIVDKMYVIKVNTPYTLTNDVNLRALNADCGLDFVNTKRNVFNTSSGLKKISMLGVNIKGTPNSLFYHAALNHYISEIDVKLCLFEGQTALLDFHMANNDFDPTHGFGNVNFLYNRLKNVDTGKIDSSKVRGFMYITDVPFKTITVDDNKVNNFTTVVGYFGTTNTYTDTARIASNMELVVANRNVVVNDDTWFDDNVANSNFYHAFILAESKTLKYYDNHVEGLKSNVGKSIYDVYASSINYYCERNVWKNNISFGLSEGALNNVLIKMKGNPLETKAATRYIRNNKYFIDSDFASRLGKEDKWLYVDLYSLTSHNIDIEIINNTIEVPYLNFGTNPLSSVVYKFNDNTIKAKRVMGSLMRITSFPSWNRSPLKSIYEWERNTVIAEEENLTPIEFATLSGQSLILMYQSYSSEANLTKLGNVSINNNTIKGDFRSISTYKALFEHIHCDTLEYSDNTFVNIAKAPYTNAIEKTFYQTNFKTLISQDNVYENFDMDGGVGFKYEATNVQLEKVLLRNYSRVRTHVSLFEIPIKDYIVGTATRKLRFDVKYRIIKPDLSEHEAKFKCILENGKFTYINSTTLAQTVVNFTGNQAAKYYTESTLLRLGMWENTANPYSTKIFITKEVGAVLDNCDIYMEVRINTDVI